jgi:predicted DNA-binding transcriptional regulator AlpA
MTDDELRRLPPLLTVPEAGRVLGIGRTVAYQLVRRDEWPTPVIRVGAKIGIPRAPLLALLGLSPTPPEPPPTTVRKSRMTKARNDRKGADGRQHVQEMLLP